MFPSSYYNIFSSSLLSSRLLLKCFYITDSLYTLTLAVSPTSVPPLFFFYCVLAKNTIFSHLIPVYCSSASIVLSPFVSPNSSSLPFSVPSIFFLGFPVHTTAFSFTLCWFLCLLLKCYIPYSISPHSGRLPISCTSTLCFYSAACVSLVLLTCQVTSTENSRYPRVSQGKKRKEGEGERSRKERRDI